MLNINRFQHNINLWAAGFSRICAGGSIYGGLKAGRTLYRARVRAIRVIIVFRYILASLKAAGLKNRPPALMPKGERPGRGRLLRP